MLFSSLSLRASSYSTALRILPAVCYLVTFRSRNIVVDRAPEVFSDPFHTPCVRQSSIGVEEELRVFRETWQVPNHMMEQAIFVLCIGHTFRAMKNCVYFKGGNLQQADFCCYQAGLTVRLGCGIFSEVLSRGSFEEGRVLSAIPLVTRRVGSPSFLCVVGAVGTVILLFVFCFPLGYFLGSSPKACLT